MAPESWSAKDERQYERVKRSALGRGRSKKRAKEIAARTVNKRRREEGRAGSRTSRTTGNPNKRLDERTVDELRNRARELDIEGHSKLRKAELVRAIRRAS